MIRVLVVDDDFMVAKVHAAFVARTPGFEVVGVAHSGATALGLGRLAARPTSSCSTSTCPTCPASRCCAGCASWQPDVDVLVISAAQEAEAVRTALRGGVVNYLLKPFDQDALRDRLQRYAATHRSLAEPTVAQTDLDRLFGAAPQRPAATRLPKGLSPESADARRRACCSAAGDDLSASECAERTGLSRVSARRYLEHFVEVGRAEVRLQYGAAGRPQRRYVWRTPRRGR